MGKRHRRRGRSSPRSTVALFSPESHIRIPAITALVTFSAIIPLAPGRHRGPALRCAEEETPSRAPRQRGAGAVSILPSAAGLGRALDALAPMADRRVVRALHRGVGRRPVALAPRAHPGVVRGHAHRRDHALASCAGSPSSCWLSPSSRLIRRNRNLAAVLHLLRPELLKQYPGDCNLLIRPSSDQELSRLRMPGSPSTAARAYGLVLDFWGFSRRRGLPPSTSSRR